MYILVREGLGEVPSREPWRARVGLRSKPQHLRFLSLDNFGIEESSLKKHHLDLLDSILVKTVEASWKTMQPIDLIRLIGHTDNTGPEKYNVGLGDRRATAVEEALKDKLKGFMSRVAIVVEPSPGETAPTADNRTPVGRAQNRRVEVFITSGGLPPVPPPKPPIDLTVKKLPQGSVIQTPPPPPYLQPPGQPLPPGKSFKQWVDERLSDHRVPKWLRNKIWEAIFGKNFGLLNSLLDAAGISGAQKKAFLETVRVLAESPTR